MREVLRLQAQGCQRGQDGGPPSLHAGIHQDRFIAQDQIHVAAFRRFDQVHMRLDFHPSILPGGNA
jgi:hypothetical protein